jgi:16S rRNA (guanine527-N7)-methyltransferase
MQSEAFSSGEPGEFGPDEFAAAINVSRETIERLKIYEEMLREWNTTQNLVSKNSLAHLWQRHFLDSAQLAQYIPDTAGSLVDLGSGAGFPGLVLAEFLRKKAEFRVVLYEATGKKCRFIEAVAGRLGLEIEIRNTRVEAAEEEIFDLITARALAPLPELLAYAQRFFGRTTMALFLKGQNIGSELTKCNKSWKMDVRQHPSITDPSGIILEVRDLKSVRKRRN